MIRIKISIVDNYGQPSKGNKMHFFNEALYDTVNGLELNVDFLKKHNYGVKNVFDGFNLDDFEYFDRIANPDGNNGYKAYVAQYGHEPIESAYHDLYDAYIHYREDRAGIDGIFEFIGCDLYIYQNEVDNYFIFGNKNVLNKFDDYQYSDEHAKKMIEEEYNEKTKEYYQFLYDTYQHL